MGTYAVSAAARNGLWDGATFTAGGAQVNATTDFFVVRLTGLPTAETTLSAAALSIGATVNSAGTLRLYGVVAGDSDTPATDAIGSYRLATILDLATVGAPNPMVFTVTFPGQGTLTTDGSAAGMNAAWRRERVSNASTGALAHGITFLIGTTDGADVTFDVYGGANPATLTTTEASARTGLSGIQYVRDKERGIASGLILCPKTGREIAADEAVVDGYTGLLCHPDGYDPPEPRRYRVRRQPNVVSRPHPIYKQGPR